MSQLAGGPTNEPVANDKAASQDAMLEAVLSAMPDRMFRLTRDGVYRAFKAERDEDNYAERERIIGGNIRELLPSDLSELVLEHIARALDNGTVETFEYELQYSDGLRSFQGRVSASGRDEAVVVVHEITREKQDAEAVRLSGQRLGTLIANLPGSVFILDRLGIVMFAGGRLFEKLGVAPEDLVGTSVLDFYDFPPDVVSHVTRALEGGSFRDRVEFRGSTFESRWSPLRGETGEITGTIGVALDITARVKAERSRDESDARFQVLMDHSTDVLLELREGRVTYISPNCQEALGLPPAHFVGRLAFDLVHPDDVPTLAPFFAPGWTGRIATRFRIRSGAGDWSWLEATGARVLDEAGKPRAVHVLRNIDEQVRADAALTASEAKYRNLVEGARDIVYTHDLQGNFTTVNARSVVVYGYTLEEILRMNIAQIIDPAYLPLALENMQRRLRGEATEAPLEFLTRAKDGSPRWVEVVSGPIVAHGAVVGFQGIVRDIGERKAAEDRLGLQAQLLDTVSQAIMVTNHRGSITYWNRYAQTLFGYSEADAVGVTALRLVAPQSRTLAVEAITRVLGGEHWSGELIACRKDGTAFPALVIGTPLYDAAGELIGTVGVAADISQLRHAEQQATFAREQAAVLEERARIAHDLHDNVAQFFFGIGIASKDLLERTSVTPTTLRRRLEHIRRLASEGGREVRRAVSALTPAQRPGGIEAWIQSLADEARATGGLEVEYAPEGSAALLSADVQNHLYRAAQEALYNVRKHARASSVCVGLRVDRNTATLQVADKGQGTAEEIERAVARGAGFGLRSLRDQFEKCGGRLVVSNNDGGGIIVTFELPASAGT